MPASGTISQRFDRVRAAFARDGFDVKFFPDPERPGGTVGFRTTGGRIGVMAEHRTARNTRTGRPKKAFYIEGDNRQMGYLIGLLAEEDVSRMAIEYVDKVVFSFLDIDAASEGGVLDALQKLIVKLICESSQDMRPSIPVEYAEELEGVLDGCRAANPSTRVTAERLWALNFGVDCALANMYTGNLFRKEGYQPALLRAPIACNAFHLCGEAAGGKSFFGRDFMFPTAHVYQDTACLIVAVPDDRGDKRRRAFVSQTAPGVVGSMTAMNEDGVAIGVDMMASRLSSAERPGFNSLPLNRHCAEYAASAGEAVRLIVEAERGVSWLYPLADARGSAYVVEAGRRLPEGERFPYFAYVPRYYRRRLPSRRYIRRMRRIHHTPKPERGVVARPIDYRYPDDYIHDWNRRLWRAFDRNWPMKIFDFAGDLVGMLVDLFSGKTEGLWDELKREISELVNGAVYSPEYFTERGCINTLWTDENCPGPFYFAPQRERRPDVLVASNLCISPEMRLTSMNEWIAIIAKANLNDFQWRYDTLNRRVLEAVDAGVDEQKAWDLINFLTPNGDFPTYYNKEGKPWREVEVYGSVSLCELSGRTITSLFGYYGDDPVNLHLMDFIE